MGLREGEDNTFWNLLLLYSHASDMQTSTFSVRVFNSRYAPLCNLWHY